MPTEDDESGIQRLELPTVPKPLTRRKSENDAYKGKDKGDMLEITLDPSQLTHTSAGGGKGLSPNGLGRTVSF